MTDGAGPGEGVVALADGTVLVRRGAGRIDVQLHRPQKRNAITAAMIEALHEVLDIVEAESPAVLVLRGVPGCFSAGADIAGYLDAAAHVPELTAFTARASGLCQRLASSDAIVVAVVDGIAMGGGFELVLAADLVIASDSSRFGLPEVRLGLIPGWGGTQRLVRFVGPNRAKQLILTGTSLGAADAASAGIVTRLVPSAELDAASAELIAELTARAPLALRAAKAAIGAAYDERAGQTPGAAVETGHLLELFVTADGLEGVAAFVGKREPQFTGR